MISDAELTVLYGNGLRPETAMRLIDEIRRERKRADDWQFEAERLLDLLCKKEELDGTIEDC